MLTAFRGHGSESNLGSDSFSRASSSSFPVSGSSSSSSEGSEEDLRLKKKKPMSILRRLSVFSLQPEEEPEALTISQGYSILSHKGEDAIGTGDQFHIVCDGVGGSQVSSAPLSEGLVISVMAALTQVSRNLNPKKGMTTKKLKKVVIDASDVVRRSLASIGPMGSTIAVAYIDCERRQLVCFNVGDCKTIVIRKGKTVFETADTIFGFNFPVQVTTTNQENYAHYGSTAVFGIQSGDICVTFSDGIGDNLYEEDILQIVRQSKSFGSTVMAERIAEEAKKVAFGDDGVSPFAVRALETCEEYLKEDKGLVAELMLSEEACLNDMMKTMRRKKPFREQEVVEDDTNSEVYSFRSLVKFATSEGGKKDDITVCVTMIE